MRSSLRFSAIWIMGVSVGCAAGSGGDEGRRDFGVADLGGGGVDARVADVDSHVPMEDAFVATEDGAVSDDAFVDEPDMASPMDGGSPDGFRVDMGTVECTIDSDCDDGESCNGFETCSEGTCFAGTPMLCGDGVPCTVDGCASGTCTHTPDDTLCAGSLTCDPGLGCVDTSCAESPCRLVAPQCGCPTGQACQIAGDASRACVADGTNAESARCDTGGCVAGTACVNVSLTATNVPVCKRYCDSDADCTGGPGSVCIAELGTTGQNVCSSNCDPASQLGCPANSFCGLFTETATGRRLTDCSGPVGTGGQGASCVGTENCQKGFTCANPGTGNQCMRWCRRSPAGGECAPGQTCIGFDPALVFNSVEYGACF
ncbi:MAG: hypothetical protein JJ863_31540 [Deltaproteobacteria bacterium]|nr:hypothetical protein [Deltaproteobacteria bacterium]